MQQEAAAAAVALTHTMRLQHQRQYSTLSWSKQRFHPATQQPESRMKTTTTKKSYHHHCVIVPTRDAVDVAATRSVSPFRRMEIVRQRARERTSEQKKNVNIDLRTK